MGIAIGHYTFEHNVTIEEIVAKAEAIGGLTIIRKKSANCYAFKNEKIAQPVSISISSDRRTVSLSQDDLGDILFSLFHYTLHSMGGQSFHEKDNEWINELSREFPIDVKRARKDKKIITLFKVIISPFSLIVTLLFSVFIFFLVTLDWISEKIISCRKSSSEK